MQLHKHLGSICTMLIYNLLSKIYRNKLSYAKVGKKFNFYAMFQNISQGLMMYQLDFEAQ